MNYCDGDDVAFPDPAWTALFSFEQLYAEPYSFIRQIQIGMGKGLISVETDLDPDIEGSGTGGVFGYAPGERREESE